MMVPSSLAVIVVGLLLGGIALAAVAWVWRRGQFDALDQQRRVRFEARDSGLDRPGETPCQVAERAAQHGPLIPARPGEWGGAE